MKSSYIVVFGSGELAKVGTQTHTAIAKQTGMKDPRVVILTTPVGFQPNKINLANEIKDHMEKALYNFHPRVNIVDIPTRKEANDEQVVSALSGADYIYFGGGSPTYLINTMVDTLLLRRVVELVHNERASLSLASASAIAFSRWSLPVYEVFKVGEELHWVEGLNISSLLSLPTTYSFLPHRNNNEGGTKLDTSYCYMGVERFKKLYALLPDPEKEEVMYGIDEHTSLAINIQTNELQSFGKGSYSDLHLTNTV